MTIYERIDQYRAEKKLSRRKLARLAGINENTFAAMFMRKPAQFPEKYLQAIAEVLGVSVYELKGFKVVSHPSAANFNWLNSCNQNINQNNAATDATEDAQAPEDYFLSRTISAQRSLNLAGALMVAQYAEKLSQDPIYRKTEQE